MSKSSLFLLTVLIALAGGCRKDAHKLTIGVSLLRISLPVFVASDRGLFKRHGLDVELRPYATAQPMVDDVLLGRLDGAGYAAYPIVFLSAKGATRGPTLLTALIEDAEHRLSYVLAKKGAHLRFPADAPGKKIGILPTAAYKGWLDAILRTASVDRRTVTVVPVAPPMQQVALSEGTVDFLFTGDPMATAALQSDGAEIADDGPPCAARLGGAFPFGSFVLSGALGEQHPETAAQLAAALDEAIALVHADPEGARASMAKFLRPEEQRFMAHYPPSHYLTSSEVSQSFLADEIAHERRLGILDFQPAIRAWAR